MSKQTSGVIGMAVMGRNLAWNIESRGYEVAIYNRSREETDEVVAESSNRKLVPDYSIEDFVDSLETPRRILLMVKADLRTDAVIVVLRPLLDDGDILIDGGNRFFKGTIRRNKELSEVGLHFIEIGVSGGGEGALHGPSIMARASAKPMTWSSRFSRRLRPRPRTARPAPLISGPMVPATA